MHRNRKAIPYPRTAYCSAFVVKTITGRGEYPAKIEPISKPFALHFQTENYAVVRKYFTLLTKTFNIDTAIAIRESCQMKKGKV